MTQTWILVLLVFILGWMVSDKGYVEGNAKFDPSATNLESAWYQFKVAHPEWSPTDIAVAKAQYNCFKSSKKSTDGRANYVTSIQGTNWAKPAAERLPDRCSEECSKYVQKARKLDPKYFTSEDEQNGVYCPGLCTS